MNTLILIIVIIATFALIVMNADQILGFFKAKKSATEEKIIEKEVSTASILGKSKFQLRQVTPDNAKQSVYEDITKKDDNFVDEEKKEDAGKTSSEVSTQGEEEREEDNLEEDIPLESEYDPLLASGSTIEELIKTNQVIASEAATRQEEEAAGKVLYENEATALFDKASADTKRRERISSLIDIYIEVQDSELSDKKQRRVKKTNSKIADFDINNFM